MIKATYVKKERNHMGFIMKIKVFLLLSLFSCATLADITQEQMEADCLKVSNFATNGDQHYKLKQYTKARNAYEQQAAWSENCGLDSDKVATAYNNVALTYIHQGKYLKARAWLNIAPNDKKSIFNLSNIKHDIEKSIAQSAHIPEGEYWSYAGRSLWNVMTIKKEKSKYRIHFDGYRVGLMAMYYGPNMGEFSTVLDIIDGKAHYAMAEEDDDDYLNCVFDFSIEKDTLTVNRTDGDACGFGFNVYAEGIYHKVAF